MITDGESVNDKKGFFFSPPTKKKINSLVWTPISFPPLCRPYKMWKLKIEGSKFKTKEFEIWGAKRGSEQMNTIIMSILYSYRLNCLSCSHSNYMPTTFTYCMFNSHFQSLCNLFFHTGKVLLLLSQYFYILVASWERH